MEKIWNFILDPNHKVGDMEFDLKNNPYSACRGNLRAAKLWGRQLLKHHKDVTKVNFMGENGRKVYTLTRTEAGLE